MLRLFLQGIRPSIMVEEIAREFEVSERAIWKDWSKRVNWLPVMLVLDPGNSGEKAAELIAMLDEVRKQLWRVYRNADNSNAEVGALKQITESIEKEFKIRHGLGLFSTISHVMTPQIIYRSRESKILESPDIGLNKKLIGLSCEAEAQ